MGRSMALDDADAWLSYLRAISMLDPNSEELLEATDPEDDGQFFPARTSEMRCV